jgi:fatty-acyl-CoA synthase
MRDAGLGSWPARRARAAPEHTAIVHHGLRQSYAELDAHCSRLAGGLRVLGVQRGHRVGYLGPNHPAFLYCLFACGALGAIFVPLNTRLVAGELEFIAGDAEIDVLVHSAEHAEVAAAIATVRPGLRLIPVDELDSVTGPDTVDEPVTLEDPAVILYTSGTTGRPKGALLSHGNITWNALSVIVDVDLASTEVTLVNAPLFHSAALGMTCLPTMLKGGSVVLEESFDVARTFQVIAEERVTMAFGVPTMFDALARSPLWPHADLSSLRYLLCGGAPVPESLIERYGQRGLAFMQGYGMTEAAPGVLLLAAQDSARKVGTAGKPAFFTDVRLSREDGSPAAAGEPGEVQVSGPNVMSEYWRRPDATERAFTEDGAFRSGDIAIADDDGFYRVVDRSKDMYISGGENVYPSEVESAIHAHPDVLDCAVIGVADEKWGEVGRALVVPDAGFSEQALIEFLDGRLARYKLPASVLIVDKLPRNAAGKLDKAALRRDYS